MSLVVKPRHGPHGFDSCLASVKAPLTDSTQPRRKSMAQPSPSGRPAATQQSPGTADRGFVVLGVIPQRLAGNAQTLVAGAAQQKETTACDRASAKCGRLDFLADGGACD